MALRASVAAEADVVTRVPYDVLYINIILFSLAVFFLFLSLLRFSPRLVLLLVVCDTVSRRFGTFVVPPARSFHVVKSFGRRITTCTLPPSLSPPPLAVFYNIMQSRRFLKFKSNSSASFLFGFFFVPESWRLYRHRRCRCCCCCCSYYVVHCLLWVLPSCCYSFSHFIWSIVSKRMVPNAFRKEIRALNHLRRCRRSFFRCHRRLLLRHPPIDHQHPRDCKCRLRDVWERRLKR